MKYPGIWVFFFVVGAALVAFTIIFSSSSISDMEFLQHGDVTRVTGTSRKLKGIGDSPSNEKQRNVDMEDYSPIDPDPSSKASIKPGPIEHGSPLIPYIPKPSPPDNPKIGGST
ncbi:QWRF motif-containing protein 2-like [Hibiscus syriacus]|uniref:QWRF motif-containing protein 2-like n=1 Tax=Hibiscus syriacus TaxID=106335 RepID=A0A6A2WJE7_HIBSY|nr:QWRF motif-containing protein 2-like [Hibiscus syriacus]